MLGGNEGSLTGRESDHEAWQGVDLCTPTANTIGPPGDRFGLMEEGKGSIGEGLPGWKEAIGRGKSGVVLTGFVVMEELKELRGTRGRGESKGF